MAKKGTKGGGTTARLRNRRKLTAIGGEKYSTESFNIRKEKKKRWLPLKRRSGGGGRASWGSERGGFGGKKFA